MELQLNGLVTSRQSGFYNVEANDGQIYWCRLRGKLKEEAQSSDIVAIGDRVTLSAVQEDGTDEINGIIESVADRDSVLSRAVRTTGKRGGGQAEREHILIANANQAFFVFAVSNPPLNFRMLDRLLVAGEKSGIEQLCIVINKVDIEDPAKIDYMISPYKKMGYDILHTSALQGDGIAELQSRMKDNISVFTGPSGVGKTSLLNQIQPGLGRTVKSVSDSSGQGMHTTRDSVLIKLADGGYLADTPGIRNLLVWDIEPDELDGYFLDMAAFVEDCRFGNCTHTDEPGCAVLTALKNGDIHPNRYENYLLLRDELIETYVIYNR
ncbi:MAG: ribosome small subunit-dependent GTPase A [Aggregatilineales bacterium]